MTCWLTVVMPVHDGAAHLGKALESVAAEGAQGVELRLYNSFDDGGAAKRVADSFADRLDIVWQDRFDLTPWTTKTNLGVEEACAEHVVMLHQDDFWLPGHLAALRASIEANPQASLSIGPSKFASDNGELVSDWNLPFAPGFYSGEAVIEALLVQNSIAIPSALVHRDAWLACGGLDEALWYTADWDLYLKLAQAGQVVVRKDATTAFRVHGNSLTVTGSRDIGDFRTQLETVLARHTARPSNRAKASIAVNCALASASSGRFGPLPAAGLSLAKLGPRGLARYLRESRIIDRLRPRLKLKLAGGM